MGGEQKRVLTFRVWEVPCTSQAVVVCDQCSTDLKRLRIHPVYRCHLPSEIRANGVKAH